MFTTDFLRRARQQWADLRHQWQQQAQSAAPDDHDPFLEAAETALNEFETQRDILQQVSDQIERNRQDVAEIEHLYEQIVDIAGLLRDCLDRTSNIEASFTDDQAAVGALNRAIEERITQIRGTMQAVPRK